MNITNKLLYLSYADVEAVKLELPVIINLIELAFKEKGAGRVEIPPKPGIHTRPDAFIHAMPAFIPALRSAGIKWVSAYPDNINSNVPNISGLIVLNDVESGMPYAIMDCSWITAYRTAAATALSAKYLARPESKVLGILACGVQGRTNLEALAVLFPIERVFVYDIQPKVQKQYVDEMSEKFNLDVIGVECPRQAVEQSELVVTSGPISKFPTPTIEADWLQPGAFASAVDFDSYWQPQALDQIEKLSTDDLSQFLFYKEVGYLQNTPDPYADLGEIVTGSKPGRERKEERILAMNLGLALDDMAVAPEIYRRAIARDIGTWLPL